MHAKEYGAEAWGIDFSSWIWSRRADILAAAIGRSYDFEPKEKK